ncbi:helix-turn-helix domain-containing protein [Microbacterium hominis]|nr:helix-turn-helix domain-containing protein [Microbacterium hominis]
MAGLWRRSVTGTARAAQPERTAVSEWLTTAQAAALVGFTDRGIRKAITEGRLDATNVDGRWRISREALAHFRSRLRAK